MQKTNSFSQRRDIINLNQAKNNLNQRVYSAGRPNISRTKINRFVDSSGFTLSN